MKTIICEASPKAIEQAVALIRDGGLVAMPTETVYGLAADATNGRAVARIFEAKGRPSFNPLISHAADLEMAMKYGEFSDMARKIAAHFWPGPLTMIVPRKESSGISDLTTAGLKTIAIRVPSHKIAQDLIKAAGVPLAAPSANASGTISPTAPFHVIQSLGGKVDMVLAAGICAIGLESSVLDLTGDAPVMLRPGAVLPEDIAAIIDAPVGTDYNPKDAPKSPGQLLRHYAPSIPLRLRAVDVMPGEALLAFGSLKFMALRGGGAASSLPEDSMRNLSEERDLNEAAANLFRMMRELDTQDHTGIAVMDIPETGLGVAINDRLKRAAQG